MKRREFLALTYRQFDALRKRSDEQQKRRDATMEFMVAQLTEYLVNTAFRTYEKPPTLADLMPSRRVQKGIEPKLAHRKRLKRSEVEEMRETMLMLAGLRS